MTKNKRFGAFVKKNLPFADFYELTDEHLGSGAYASVRTCISKEDGQEYAVKIVDKQDESHTRWRLLRYLDFSCSKFIFGVG